jgi:hypothetical protein
MPKETRNALWLVTVLALVPSLAVAWSIFWPIVNGVDRYGYVVGRDFANFWFAGQLAAQGRLAELYDLFAYHAALKAALAPTEPFMNFSYLPNVLPLLLPLSLLPYAVALTLWCTLGLVAFVLAVTGFPVAPGRRHLVPMLLLSPIVILVTCFAQSSLLLAALFVGAFRLLPSRPRLAGVLIGLLSFKPHIAILLPLVLAVRSEWAAMAAAAATAAGLALLSVLLFGTAPWHDYVAYTLPYQARLLAEPGGFVWTMMISPYAFLCQLGVPPALALKAHAVLAVAVAGAALAVVRVTRASALTAAVVGFAAVLIPPYALAYDLAIPAAGLMWWLSEDKRPLRLWELALVGAFWVLPFVLMALNVLHVPVMPPIIVALFWWLVALALGRAGEFTRLRAVVVRLARQAGRPGRSTAVPSASWKS